MKISLGVITFVLVCLLMFAVVAIQAFAVPYDPGIDRIQLVP